MYDQIDCVGWCVAFKVDVRGIDFSNCGWKSFSFSEKVLASLCSVERAETFWATWSSQFLKSFNSTREKNLKTAKKSKSLWFNVVGKVLFFQRNFSQIYPRLKERKNEKNWSSTLKKTIHLQKGPFTFTRQFASFSFSFSVCFLAHPP